VAFLSAAIRCFARRLKRWLAGLDSAATMLS
jgi:hypothetical protein